MPIVEGVREDNYPVRASQFSVSDNGSLVYVPAPEGVASQLTLALVDRTGSPKPLGLPPGPYSSPRISPNGKQVAFSTDDGKDRVVWIYDLDGKSAVRRLTFGGKNGFPIYSADGKRIIFSSDRDGGSALFWQAADGSGTPERLTKPVVGRDFQHPEAVSPDGRVLTLDKAGNSIWVLELDGDRTPKELAYSQSRGDSFATTFSRDGRWIAYHDLGQVYVEPYPPTGARYLVTKDGGVTPVWSADGKELFFMKNGLLQAVSVRTQPTVTFSLPAALPITGIARDPGANRIYDVTPDGKQFVVLLPPGATSGDARQTLQIQVVLNWLEELKARMPVK